jgi:mRNA-degrading endonuclease RelE of RelBE toxin-antitoxin system
MKIELSDQVVEFVKSLPPQPRRRLRLALRKLADEKGDIQSLEGPLSSYRRLRAGPFRLILAYQVPRTGPTRIQCLFAERRGTVYTVFSEMLKKDLLE